MDREIGFYWAKYGEDWTVGEWCSRPADCSYWIIIGNEIDMRDDELDEIGERIEPPK
jgi:hypothetical protein